ncbi:hypothetical protein TrRE_jg3463, partial [Triparma retinervis]
MVSGPPPRGAPPGKGKPKKRQSAALLYKLQQKEGGSTPKNRPTTPESKDNGEVLKSADWGVTPERESYDSYRRGGDGNYDSDYEFGERAGGYTSSEDEGYGYRRRRSDSRYSDDASNSYENDESRYSPR